MNNLFAQTTACYSTQKHYQQLQTDNAYQSQWKNFTKYYAQVAAQNSSTKDECDDVSVYSIPLVIHVVYTAGTPLGIDSHLSTNEVMAGVDFLNEAFAGTLSCAQSGIDAQIEFCLAQRTINDEGTSGIIYHESDLANFDACTQEIDLLNLQNIADFPTQNYLNIWLVNELCLSCNNLACNASTIASFPAAVGSFSDVMIAEASNWNNSNDACEQFKPIVHEIAHYLGLLHTYEGGCTNNNCLTDGDGVCDTPPDNSIDSSYNNTCLFGLTQNSCTTDVNAADTNNPFSTDQNDLTNNFMDAVPVECMSSFTPGQIKRMRTTLCSLRNELISGNACEAVCANPPIAIFSTIDTAIIVGTNITFTNLSENATQYAWQIGNNTSTATNPNINFNLPGIYGVSLTASNNTDDCVPSISTSTIEVVCPVKPNFIISPASAILGESITVENLTEGNNLTFSWYLDDVLYSNDVQISLDNLGVGLHTLRLVACNDDCCETFGSRFISVNTCENLWFNGDFETTTDEIASGMPPQCYTANFNPIHIPDDVFGSKNWSDHTYGEGFEGHWYWNDHAITQGANQDCKPNGSDLVILAQNIPTVVGQTYHFGAWLHLHKCYVPSGVFGLAADGALLNFFELFSDECFLGWRYYYVEYTATAPYTEFSLVAVGEQGYGWDFGIDDIVLSPNPDFDYSVVSSDTVICAGTSPWINVATDADSVMLIDYTHGLLMHDALGNIDLGVVHENTEYAVIFYNNNEPCPQNYYFTIAIDTTCNNTSSCESDYCFQGNNLFQNADFEKIDNCADNTFSAWELVGNANTQIFHTNCSPAISADFPYSGAGMLGSEMSLNNVAGNYLKQALPQNLEIGATYELSFWTKAVSNNDYCALLDALQIGFSTNNLNNINQIQNISNGINIKANLVSSGTQWQKVCINFTADAAYQYFYLGFNPNEGKIWKTCTQSSKTFYWFDNFSLRKNISHINFDWIEADTTVCKGQNAYIHFSTNATSVQIVNEATGETNNIAGSFYVWNNVQNDACYKLMLENNACTDSISFCVHAQEKQAFTWISLDTLVCEGAQASINFTTDATHVELWNTESQTAWTNPSLPLYLDYPQADSCYTLYLENAQKHCDTLINFCIKPNFSFENTLTAQICASETYTLSDGTTVNESGTYTLHFSSENYCDSLVTTVLEVIQPSIFTQTISICEGEIFAAGSNFYNTSGTYTDTLQNYWNCDSLLITELSVYPIQQNFQTIAICPGDSVLVGTSWYKNEGTYTDLLQTTYGCDSVVTTQVVWQTQLFSENEIVICKGEFWQVGQHFYQNSGIYLDTLPTSLGCDSIITTKLTVGEADETFLTHEICPSDSIQINQMWISENTTIEENLQNALGCDSTVFHQINLLESAFFEENIALCPTDTLFIDEKPLTEEGIYPFTYAQANGCDSTYIVHLLLKKCDAQSCKIIAPTAFSPNNDGLNDRFGFRIDDECFVSDFHWAVYNRWGQQIFASDSPTDKWNGYYQGTICAVDVYVWSLEYRLSANGTMFRKFGNITLVR
ncbi:MAG: gliding motility-associated C-terminal domain-containing protein [Chitinophagales bacterium]